MKKQQRQNGNKPVTLNQLKQVIREVMKKMDIGFKQVDERFKRVDEQFKQVDTRFKEMGGWFHAAQSIHALYTDRAIQGLEERMSKKHNDMMSLLDKFLKRTDVNEREITFLGKQHDNLAKYCHEKIAYPEYGRKL